MISKNKIKLIKSLERKKVREELKLFVAEGNKLVEDILSYFDCEILIAKQSWISKQIKVNVKELIIADDEEIQKTSLLKSPQDVIAVFKQPERLLKEEKLRNGLNLLLDDIQDPGNLGTIIRIADWFGIENIICSPNSVDVYNPKVIQATMGAISRVNVFYEPLPLILKKYKDLSVYGTFLEGNNIYKERLSSVGFIVMGNEGNGISKEVERLVNNKLYIPNYPSGVLSTESLNVAVATAITCAEFRRQQINSI